MMHEENCNCENKEEHMHYHMGGSMKKEFKLAMLEKKQKIIEAELEFIEKMKEMIKKMPEQEK